MAIKVHGNVVSTAAMRVAACLNEKELDYEYVHVNMRDREHKTESFLSLNVSTCHSETLKVISKITISLI